MIVFALTTDSLPRVICRAVAAFAAGDSLNRYIVAVVDARSLPGDVTCIIVSEMRSGADEISRA
jgi:hypothetical protein